jgi:hypothetical protein
MGAGPENEEERLRIVQAEMQKKVKEALGMIKHMTATGI